MTQSDIDQLVQKLQALHTSQPSLQANFREERHLAMLKEPVVNEGKVWFTLPDKIRREIGGKTPSTTVTDGKKVSIYYPNYQQLEVYDLEKRPIIKDTMRALTAGLNFREVASYYQIEGSKNGSDYQLTLTPKTAAVRKLLKSVDLTIDEGSDAREGGHSRQQRPGFYRNLYQCAPRHPSGIDFRILTSARNEGLDPVRQLTSRGFAVTNCSRIIRSVNCLVV